VPVASRSRPDWVPGCRRTGRVTSGFVRFPKVSGARDPVVFVGKPNRAGPVVPLATGTSRR
jgi:hypothetical protein